jgi:hypothetical protein
MDFKSPTLMPQSREKLTKYYLARSGRIEICLLRPEYALRLLIFFIFGFPHFLFTLQQNVETTSRRSIAGL